MLQQVSDSKDLDRTGSPHLVLGTMVAAVDCTVVLLDTLILAAADSRMDCLHLEMYYQCC